MQRADTLAFTVQQAATRAQLLLKNAKCGRGLGNLPSARCRLPGLPVA
jgi:hypothetical protein